jgi:amidohydrolase
VRAGAITAASDTVEVRLSGPGGHTARPHLTADLVYALADVVTRVPAVLSRKVDPRAGLSVVWGQVHAGTANNVIPRSGFAAGTVRVLDRAEWRQAADVVAAVIREVAAPHDVQVAIDYVRGVPPVVNVAECAAVFSRAGASVLGDHAVVSTTQSLGGEDFAWYLEHVPGALARLGVRRPGEQAQLDLHRGSFDVDERAIGCGVRVLVATAVEALRAAGA